MADITGTIYGATSNSMVDAKIEWEETVSVVSNQGTVTARLYLRTRTGYVTSSGNSTFTLYIGSASSGEGSFSFSIGPGNEWVLADTAYAYVAHNSDGTKSIAISASGKMSGSSVSSISCSATVALYAIPRASTFALPDSVEVNGTNAVTVNITRMSGAYTHRVRIYTESTYAGSTYKTELTDVGTSVSYAIPASWRLSMPTSVSKVINVEVTTFNGAAQVGNSKYGTFAITVPSNVKPTVDATNVTLAPVQADEIGGFTHYVQGLSACGATFDSLASDFSSEVAITGYYIQIGGTKTSSTPFNSSTFEASGDYTITVGVTDARERTGTYTQTITVYPYDEPLITGLSVFRANGSGVASDTGGYVAITGTPSYSDCGGDNGIAHYRARYKAASSGSYGAWENLTSGETTLIGGGSLLSAVTYNVEVQVVDFVSSPDPYPYVIPTASVAFNIKNNGNGAAFFKYAETDGLVDIAGDVKAVDGTFTGDVVADSVTATTPIGYSSGGTNAMTPGGIVNNIKTPLVNLLYPVGSIYLSVAETSPATLFGGTWEQIQDKFLLSAGSTYAAGATGGEAEHTLTVGEMPAHNHNFVNSKVGGTGTTQWVWASGGGNNTTAITNAGGGQAHNNMPPYLAVYVWKRTA